MAKANAALAEESNVNAARAEAIAKRAAELAAAAAAKEAEQAEEAQAEETPAEA